MSQLQQLHSLISKYLDGTISVEELEDALADLALPISESGDDQAASLNALVWLLLSEHGYGDRDESSVRSELEQAMLAPRSA
jgi:hypothetical protein